MEAAGQRFARYTKVPPGRYRFQVIACTNDGVWNETGATLALVFRPYFWQTKWFLPLAIAASGRPRYPGFLPYYVAKAGVVALTEALALEVAADRILVNAVAPGPILAPPGITDEELNAVEAATPLGRWGGPDAIVRAVLFLVETDFVTGETIRVDGGRHLK